MKFAIKKKIYQISAYLFLFVPLFNQAHATGVPVADAAAISQMITQYMHQLKDYTTQLDSLQQEVNQFEQQMKDATKPVENAFDTANSIIQSGSNLYNYVDNLSERFQSAKNLLNTTIGSRQKWEECASSSSCNPVDMYWNSYEALADIFDDGTDQILKVRDSLLTSQKKVAQTYSKKIAQSKGHQEVLELTGQALTSKMQSDADFQSSVLSHMERSEIEKEQERRKRLEIKERSDKMEETFIDLDNLKNNIGKTKLKNLP